MNLEGKLIHFYLQLLMIYISTLVLLFLILIHFVERLYFVQYSRVSCDLPATRKVCGFYSFSSLHGCSKCLKEFPTTSFGSKPDYSGFNTESWCKRSLATHTAKAFAAKEAVTAAAQQWKKS